MIPMKEGTIVSCGFKYGFIVKVEHDGYDYIYHIKFFDNKPNKNYYANAGYVHAVKNTTNNL